jgi:hypothetical protein
VFSNINLYNNQIHDGANWMDAADAAHADGMIFVLDNANSAPYNTITNMSIYNNSFYGNWVYALNPESAPHISGFLYFSTNGGETSAIYTNTNIYNNVFVDGSGNGYPAVGDIAFQGGMNGLLIANNTHYGAGPGTAVAFYSGANGYNNVRVENNIVDGVDIYANAVTGTSYTWDYNDYYGGNQMFKLNGTAYGSLSAWQKAIGGESHSITSNPTLNANYQLQSGSPAILAGTNLTSLGITALDSDAAGNARPSTGAWDMGCYEYSSLAPPQNLQIRP